jgi:hypothetical protein
VCQLDLTAPYAEAWSHEYGPLGLVVVGVHAPSMRFAYGKAARVWWWSRLSSLFLNA